MGSLSPVEIPDRSTSKSAARPFTGKLIKQMNNKPRGNRFSIAFIASHFMPVAGRNQQVNQMKAEPGSSARHENRPGDEFLIFMCLSEMTFHGAPTWQVAPV